MLVNGVDIDQDMKECIIVVGAMLAAAIGCVFDGVSSDQFIMVLMACLAYGFGKYNQSTQTKTEVK